MNAAPPTYDAHSSTHLRPYLQLPHLLSLTWLAYPILSLVFVVFRLQLSLASSQDAVAGAKSDLLTSCKAAEKAATAAASMPRYMAIATNEQFANAVNDSMNAAREALILALTIMEAIINFIVDIYRSTFLCFLELVIRGGLAILIGAVQELNVVVQAAASGIRTAIQDSVGAANSAIQGLASVASKIGISIPTLSVPDLTSLENVTLPQSFTDSITALNNSLPTFNELKQTVEKFIDTPFELLKADINDTFSGLSFNSSVLAVPEQNTLSFCTDLDTSVIDNLGHDLVKIAKIGTLILILLILILIGLNCLLEWYKWRCQRRHLEYTRQAWNTDPTLYHQNSGGVPNVTLSDHNLLMLQANGAHPLLTRIANTLSAKLRLSPSKHIHLQWFLHYVFHPPALACFLIGFFGLLSVELQLLAIHPLVDKYSAQAADTATGFSNTIATSINASMYNQSAAYASSVNAHVDSIQSTINDGLFGWVNSTTTTLNTTIENFYEDIQNAVNLVFNNTILDAPIQEFIKCIIGSKVDAIENALTFLHDNLNINMPRVNETILVLSPQSVDEATQPIAAAAVGDQNGDGGLIGKLVNSYAASLRKERLMFGIFMALWGVVVLMGLAIILWHSYGRQFVEKRRRRKWEREQRSLPMAEEKGFGSGSGSGSGNIANEHSDLPSFTPLPSPKLGGSFNPFAFGRSASPKPPKNADSGSMNSFEKSNNRSWDTFFDKPKSSRSNITTKEISKPMKLISFGRRGREVFVGDRRAPTPLSTTEELEPDQSGRRTTKWFARVAGLLGKPQQSPTIEPYPEFSPNRNSGARVRPTLRITVASDLASEAEHNAPVPQQLDNDRSRWSVSPENTARAPIRPWTGLMSPTTGAWRHKHKPSVPSNVNSMDVNSLYDVSRASVPAGQPTPLAMPLHSGFDVPRKQAILPQHPAIFTPAPGPETRHRRSISVPAPTDAYNYNHDLRASRRLTVRNAADVPPPVSTPTQTPNNPFSDVHQLAVPANDPQPSTPVTRLLTTTHARRSSSVNPFVTPFDDEHRVTIAHSDARKSVQTNPFTAVAV
ncbi:Plasma membrane fusion protein PRM1 [Mycena venus]|uniref:Plasma membrane fusion protein PRM1 n=1 Tax=Mycena venus TaxID=2733690 RepID=A0A8H6YBW3_9AGAR|nr:Plasma membrane fusion protein PRM1 [Mycena venus]